MKRREIKNITKNTVSYSIREAKLERDYDIATARRSVDAPERLRAIARQVAKEDNEPLADALYREAIKIEMAYDEARDNEM